MKTRCNLPPNRSKIDPTDDLSARDRAQLARLEKKLQPVREQIDHVVRGRSRGFLLQVEGDIGRSNIVLGPLKRLGAKFRLYKGPETDRGLYVALRRSPTVVHVLDGIEWIADDSWALTLLS